MRPNTPYVVVTLEHTVVTGGFYLSSHTLYETLVGLIHSFVLPSLLTEGKKPPLTIFARRLVHYMHNSYIVNDSSDRSHLLSFSTLDDARDLFSLVTVAIFLNVLDDRTYQLSSETFQEDPAVLQQCHDFFDLNAIPVVERHHLCYTRGLSIDLLNWFFENYSFSSIDLEDDDVNGYTVIFIPFIIHIGRQIVRYKRIAEGRGHMTTSTSKQVIRQVQSALFGFEYMKDAWLEDRAAEEEGNYQCDASDDESIDLSRCDLECDLSGYTISQREQPESRRSTIKSFLEDGKTNADQRFFRGLTSLFKLEELGKIYACRKKRKNHLSH